MRLISPFTRQAEADAAPGAAPSRWRSRGSSAARCVEIQREVVLGEVDGGLGKADVALGVRGLDPHQLGIQVARLLQVQQGRPCLRRCERATSDSR